MRISFETKIIRNDDGVPCAVFARADYCGEHEFGLGNLYDDFQCGSEGVLGIERYQPTKKAITDNNLMILSDVKIWSRVNGRKKSIKTKMFSATPVNYIPDDGLFIGNNASLVTWFDGRNFAIAAINEEGRAFVENLHAHAKTGDMAAFMGGETLNPFDRGGLLVSIPSLMPEHQLEVILKVHEDAKKLKDTAQATGVIDAIKTKAQDFVHPHKSPYLLRSAAPAWLKNEDGSVDPRIARRMGNTEIESDYDVVFDIVGVDGFAGCYTVEELYDWIDQYEPGRVLQDIARYKENQNQHQTSGMRIPGV